MTIDVEIVCSQLIVGILTTETVSKSSLGQRLTNCGSRPKSGSLSSVKWVVKVFLEIIFSFICKGDKNALTTVLGVFHRAEKLTLP